MDDNVKWALRHLRAQMETPVPEMDCRKDALDAIERALSDAERALSDAEREREAIQMSYDNAAIELATAQDYLKGYERDNAALRKRLELPKVRELMKTLDGQRVGVAAACLYDAALAELGEAHLDDCTCPGCILKATRGDFIDEADRESTPPADAGSVFAIQRAIEMHDTGFLSPEHPVAKVMDAARAELARLVKRSEMLVKAGEKVRWQREEIGRLEGRIAELETEIGAWKSTLDATVDELNELRSRPGLSREQVMTLAGMIADAFLSAAK